MNVLIGFAELGYFRPDSGTGNIRIVTPQTAMKEINSCTIAEMNLVLYVV